jgi:sulfoxide reductase catalytic subunit YedY
MSDIDRSEITPEYLYLSRRKFIKGLGAAATGAAVSAVLAACAPGAQPPPATETPAPSVASEATPTAPSPQEEATSTATPAPTTDVIPTPVPAAEPPAFPTVSASEDDMGSELTTEQAINTYNNFYEFTFSKEGVASLAQDFQTDPWSVEVGGLVENPRTYSMGDLYGFEQEERIYRMRCVEGWSMVIPWVGFPLARLLEEVTPTSEAKFVRFETLYDPEQMPGQKGGGLPWPYVEGLRLDEAMHDLTILATGLYAKPLKPQTGAPIRLVVPWKYGFKSIKSIVKIDLVDEMPTSTWMDLAPHEYGFYANVNPDVPHPRWSQATERRIGEIKRRETLLFNGYEDEVAYLYEDLDLTVWY